MELLIGLGVLYLMPSIIALLRGHSNIMSILVVNLLLGWTLIGWVISLAWSVSSQKPRS